MRRDKDRDEEFASNCFLVLILALGFAAIMGFAWAQFTDLCMRYESGLEEPNYGRCTSVEVFWNPFEER